MSRSAGPERQRQHHDPAEVAVDAAPQVREQPEAALHRPVAGGLAFPVQRTVVVGTAHDPAELEADRVAAAVVDAFDAAPAADAVHRSAHDHATGCGCHGTEVRRRVSGSVGLDGGELSAEVEHDLRAGAGAGTGLEPRLRGRLEGALGADLSSVRLHAGDQANRLNRSMSAEAFTHGRDIYFRDGLPDAGTRPGLHLLAHEVAHTVQQGTSPAVRRMYTVKLGKRDQKVTTLTGLNQVIKDLRIAGGEITIELLEGKGDFAEPLKAAAVDKAVAESELEVTGKLKQGELITELVSRLKAPKAAPKQKDPLTLRTEAMKRLTAHKDSTKAAGTYFCGGSNEPHVHLYTDGFHLKKINGIDRINVVQSNILYANGLKEAREAASNDPRGYDVHIAIDKCLVALKKDLDDY